MTSDGIVDCPRCGRRASAWEGSFCGQCEQVYRQAEEERLRALYAREQWDEDNPWRPFGAWAREQGLL